MKIRINYAGKQRWRLTFGKGWKRTRTCRRLYVFVPVVGVMVKAAGGYRTRAYLEADGPLDLKSGVAFIGKPAPRSTSSQQSGYTGARATEESEDQDRNR